MPTEHSSRPAHRRCTIVPLHVTSALCADHELIRRSLTVLRRLAQEVDAGVRFPAAAIATVARFLREFAEHQHHRKEEALLMAMLAAQGADDAAEGVGELMRDHAETRELLYT